MKEAEAIMNSNLHKRLENCTSELKQKEKLLSTIVNRRRGSGHLLFCSKGPSVHVEATSFQPPSTLQGAQNGRTNTK